MDRNPYFHNLFTELLEHEKFIEDSQPILYLDEFGDYRVNLQKSLIPPLKIILKGINKLLQCRKAHIFLNEAGGTRISIRNHKEKLSSYVNKILDKTLVEGKIGIYFPGEPILSSDNKEQIDVAHEHIISVPIAVNNKSFGVFLFSEPITKGSFNINDEKFLLDISDAFSKFFEKSAIYKDNHTIYSGFFSSLLLLLEKSYLQHQLNHSNETLDEVMHVSKLINSSTDLESLLLSILSSAKRVLVAESSSLLLIDEQTNELYFNNVSGEKEKELKEIRVPMGTGIAGIVAQSGEPLIINDAESDERVYKDVDQHTNYHTRNLMCAPLRVRKKIIGVIEVLNSLGRNNFNDGDLNLFLSFSDHAALAIHNRDLIDNLQATNIHLERRVNELSTLFQVSSMISTAKYDQEIFDNIVRIIVEKLKIKGSAILLYDTGKDSFRITSQYGLPRTVAEKEFLDREFSFLYQAFAKNHIIHFSDLDEPVPSNNSKVDSPVNSDEIRKNIKSTGFAQKHLLIYPLHIDGSTIGLISFSEKEDEDPFFPEDRATIQIIVNQILKGYENILLNQEIIKNETLKKEVETSKKIQTAILPHKIPKLDHIEMAALSKPAMEVGGDFYDFTLLGRDKMGIIIADVSGKSLPAALFMASTSSIIRTLSLDVKNPPELLYKGNDLVYQNSQAGMFVTLFYLVIDQFSKNISFSSAGHNQQIFLPSEGEVEFLKAKGPPLGVLPMQEENPYTMGTRSFTTGDHIILYTDGVIEAVNERDEEFGMDRFLQLLRDNRSKTAQDIVDRIYEEVSSFSGSVPQFDDFTMVVVKMT